MSVSTDLTEHRKVVQELCDILEDFFRNQRTLFNPNCHLTPRALELYNYTRKYPYAL